MLIKNGATPKQVQMRLGHAKSSITLNVYTHLWEADEDRTAGMMEAALGDVPWGWGNRCPMGALSEAKIALADWRSRTPRSVRLAVVIPLLIAVWTACAVFWHVVLDHAWLDSFVFVFVMGVAQVAVQLWMDRRQKQRQRDQ